MHLERGLRGVDDVEARRAGPEHVGGPHVEPAPVQLVEQPVALGPDRLRIGQPGDEVRPVLPAAFQAREAVGGRRGERGQRRVDARRLHVDARRSVHERPGHDERDRDERADSPSATRATTKASSLRARTSVRDRPPDREQHQRREPPRPQQQIEEHLAEDARRRRRVRATGPRRARGRGGATGATAIATRRRRNRPTRARAGAPGSARPRHRHGLVVAHERVREQLHGIELRSGTRRRPRARRWAGRAGRGSDR